MSLHEDPKTPAEKFALHLETNYGVQLDAYRRQALVRELEAFSGGSLAEEEAGAVEWFRAEIDRIGAGIKTEGLSASALIAAIHKEQNKRGDENAE